MRNRTMLTVVLLAAGATTGWLGSGPSTLVLAKDKKDVPFPAPGGTIETRAGKLSFPAGYPSKEATAKLYDEMDYQRAVQA